MAVLILSESASTRNSLRHLLLEIGFQSVLTAQSQREALDLGSRLRDRLLLRVVDLDTFTSPLSGGATTLAVASTSASASTSNSGENRHSTSSDAFLIKPFGRKTLEKSLFQAFSKHASRRNVVVFHGDRPPPESLQQALLKSAKWTEVRAASDTDWGRVGLVIFSPEKRDIDPSLSAIHRSLARSEIACICLSRAPADTYHLRKLCQFFVEPPRKPGEWAELLARIENHQAFAWKTSLLLKSAKQSLAQNHYQDAEVSALEVIHNDTFHREAIDLLGEISQVRQDFHGAKLWIEKSLALNPTHVRAHIQGIQTARALGSNPGAPAEIERALRYCPRLSDLAGPQEHETPRDFEEDDT